MNNFTDKENNFAIVSYLREVLADMFAVAGELFTALEEMNNPEFRERAARLTRGMCRIMRTLDNVAYLDSIEESVCYFEPSTVDVNQWLGDFYARNSAYVASAERNIVFEPDADVIIAELDITLIRLALLNLISNAILSTQPGGTILLRAVQEREHLLLTVSDNGAGFPTQPADGTKVTTDYCDFSGRPASGLGLRIVQEAARLHSGSLLLAGSPELGVSATLRLPLALPKTAHSHPPVYDIKAGFDPSLTQLSDCLPAECYMFYF